MECQNNVNDSPVYTGSGMNRRSFEDNESWTSLQSTILAGQLSMSDPIALENPRRKSLTTVEEEDDDNEQNPLDMNLDAISDDEVFYDCTNPSSSLQEYVPRERPEPEGGRAATATSTGIVGDGFSVKLNPSSVPSSTESAYFTGEQKTASPTKLSTASWIYKSCEPLCADSGIGDDKTGTHLIHMIEDLRLHAQSTPKLPGDVDFSSILTAATCSSGSIISSLAQCRESCVTAAVGSIANEEAEAVASIADVEARSPTMHSAPTLQVGGSSRARSRLTATSSSSAIGLRLDTSSCPSSNASGLASASNSISSSYSNSGRSRRHVSFNTSRRSVTGSSSSARPTLAPLENRRGRRSSGSSASSGSLRPRSSNSSSVSSSASVSSSSLRASPSRKTSSNSLDSPISNRLPKSPYVTRRRYGPPRRKVVPELASFFEHLNRAQSSGSCSSTRTSKRLGASQSRACSESSASQTKARRLTFRVLSEVKLRRSSPRKAPKAPPTPWKPRQQQQQQESSTPASRVSTSRLNSTAKSKIPVHIESARKRAARTNSNTSSCSGASAASMTAKSRPVGGKSLAVRDVNVIANAAARLKPVDGLPLKRRLMSPNHSIGRKAGANLAKNSPLANQSSIVKRRSVGLVSSPVRPVRQLRKIFSPAAANGKSLAKNLKKNIESSTQSTNQVISYKKPMRPTKPVMIPRIIVHPAW